MANAMNIVLLSDAPSTIEAVYKAINHPQSGMEPAVCRSQSELVAYLEQTPAAAVLLDIDPYPRRVLDELEPLVNQLGKTRFIALSDSVTQELMIRAMEVGVRYYLPKASIAAELGGVLKRMLTITTAAGTFGSVVTVLSAGGGCGSTTIAVNLANELQLSSRQPSLLVDLDQFYGAVAVYLGLKAQYSLADLLSRTGPMDADLIQSTAMQYNEHLHVLVSPSSVDFGNPRAMDLEHLDEALDLCAQKYRWIVIDAPRVPMAFAARLARSSHTTLIACQMSVKDIRCARDIHNVMMAGDVRPNSIHFVASRFRRDRRMLTQEEAEQALGGVKLELVHNDFDSAIESINLGHTLERCAPRSILRQDIKALADLIATPPITAHRFATVR